MTDKENRRRMSEGLIYDPNTDDLISEQLQLNDIVAQYNSLLPTQMEEKDKLTYRIFGSRGKNIYLESPFYTNWGGRHVFIGDNFYSNHCATFIDDGNIYIGDNVMLGPNVTLITAGHPVAPELRLKGLQFNKDIHIGNNVWIGAGANILPGISVGDNCVIGAGSVVTKDIPSNCVAVGNPCRILRQIGDHDKEFYFKDLSIDPGALEY